MSTKSILINFSGYPNEPFNLMPDNGLVNLATSLIAKGHTTLIWDCMTVDIIKKLYPYEHSEEFQGLVGNIMNSLKQQAKPEVSTLDRYYYLNEEIKKLKQEKVKSIGIEIANYIKNNKIDFVGMKLWSGGGFSGSIIIANEIKKINPKIKIFGGGPHLDWFREKVYEVTDIFEVLSYGEGEEIISMLADYVEGKTDLNNIPNIIYKKNGKVVMNPIKVIKDLNTIPSPNYNEDIYPAMKGDQKFKAILIEESRGCPNACNFCIHPGKSGGKRRVVDSIKLVNEIEMIKNKYGISAFRLTGSNPLLSQLKDISEEIIRRNLDIKYSAFAHVRGGNTEQYEVLKKSGCCALSFGLESGSQKILDESINKKTKVPDIKKSLIMCKDSGIKTVVFVIVPAPLETEATKQETFDLLLEVKPDSVNVCFPALIYGTEWDRNKVKYQIEVKNSDDFYKKEMFYEANHLAPPILWEPVDDYKVNGLPFSEICRQTAGFMHRLEKEGLTTQLFDHNLLLAEFTSMSAHKFGQESHHYLQQGKYEDMKKLVAQINQNILKVG